MDFHSIFDFVFCCFSSKSEIYSTPFCAGFLSFIPSRYILIYWSQSNTLYECSISYFICITDILVTNVCLISCSSLSNLTSASNLASFFMHQTSVICMYHILQNKLSNYSIWCYCHRVVPKNDFNTIPYICIFDYVTQMLQMNKNSIIKDLNLGDLRDLGGVPKQCSKRNNWNNDLLKVSRQCNEIMQKRWQRCFMWWWHWTDHYLVGADVMTKKY